MRIRLAPGVWTNFAAISLGGLGAWAAASATQVAQQAVGWAGIVVGISLLLWGITVDGDLWWRRLPLTKEMRVPTDGWVPLHLALRYIALRSEWGFAATPAPAGLMDKELERIVAERLARGELAARGREVLSSQPYRLTVTSVPIAPDFWPTAFFQAFAEIVLADDTRGSASRNGSFTHVPFRAYREVVLDLREVKRIWPEASAKILRVNKSPFYYALIHHWKGEIMQDGGFATDFEMWAAYD